VSVRWVSEDRGRARVESKVDQFGVEVFHDAKIFGRDGKVESKSEDAMLYVCNKQ
jgi:hypothetical protein